MVTNIRVMLPDSSNNHKAVSLKGGEEPQRLCRTTCFFYKREHWASERKSNGPKVTQLPEAGLRLPPPRPELFPLQHATLWVNVRLSLRLLSYWQPQIPIFPTSLETTTLKIYIEPSCSQLYVNEAPVNYTNVATDKGVIHGLGKVLEIQKNRCDSNDTTVVRVSYIQSQQCIWMLAYFFKF